MCFDSYFSDQFSHASHTGSVRRHKRYLKDLNQALYQVKVAQSTDDDESDGAGQATSSSLKQQTDDVHLQTILRKSKTPIIPEVLTKDQIYFYNFS